MTKKEHIIPEGILRKSLKDYCDHDCISKEINEVTKTAPFICDGFANEETYTKLKGPKVLFIGKEPHDFTEGKSPIICNEDDLKPENFKKWSKNTFYQNLMFYFYAIDSLYSTPPKYTFELSDCNLKTEDDETVSKLIERFKKIAFINIKKWDTQDSTSREDTINQYAEEYKVPLREQIKAIDPDIIFLCGTESAFNKLIDEDEWKKEYDDFKNLSCLNCNNSKSQWFYFLALKEEEKTRLVINYYHPSSTQRPGWIDVLALQNIMRNAITYMKAHKGDKDFESLLEKINQVKINSL